MSEDEIIETESQQGQEEISTQENVEKIVSEANAKSTVEEAPTAQEYAANYKYKVLDSEHEFDEFIRPFITDAEKENKIRDLYTKAAGLDRYKASNEELSGKAGQYEKQLGEYQPVIQQYHQLSQLAVKARNDGDYGQFFAAAQMNPQQVIQWAAQTVAAQERNPQYLQQQNQQYQNQFQTQQYQTQAQTYEQQNQVLQEQMYQQQLSYELMNPQNAEFSKEFDSRAGGPGAFQKEVVQYGAMLEATTGQTVPPSQIISELKARYQGFLNPSAGQAPIEHSLSQEAGQPQENRTQGGKPVLPNIKGKSQSPVKKQIGSTDDLRNLRSARAQ